MDEENKQKLTPKKTHYSSAENAWNNVVCGPVKGERQLKHTPSNFQSQEQWELKKKLQDAYSYIREAREHLKYWQQPSDETTRQYSLALKRLIKTGLWPEDYAQTKKGYYFYRAAVVNMSLHQLQQLIVQINKLQKNKDHTWINIAFDLKDFLVKLKIYPPDQEQCHLAKGIKSRWKSEEKSSRTTAKRKGLGTLPKGWRQIFWNSIPENSPHRLPIALLSSTGLRPSELKAGVKIEIHDQNQLNIFIIGSKTQGGKFGQQVRLLTLDPHTEEAHFILQQARENDGQVWVKIHNPKALSEAVRRYSKKLWPRKKYIVSPYSFRHQLSADIKNQLTPEEIAMALGHCTTRTQQYYGMRNQSGKRVKQIIRVSAEKNLRPSPSPSYNPGFTSSSP